MVEGIAVVPVVMKARREQGTTPTFAARVVLVVYVGKTLRYCFVRMISRWLRADFADSTQGRLRASAQAVPGRLDDPASGVDCGAAVPHQAPVNPLHLPYHQLLLPPGLKGFA